jgi:hypothetical protein
VSRGQRGGSPTVVNLSFLDRVSKSVKIKIDITVINYNTACFSVRAMRDICWMAVHDNIATQK